VAPCGLRERLATLGQKRKLVATASRRHGWPLGQISVELLRMGLWLLNPPDLGWPFVSRRDGADRSIFRYKRQMLSCEEFAE
jgi:hypothetical protein